MKAEAPPTIRQTAAHLLNSRQRLLNRILAELSDLRPTGLAYLEEVWPQIALKRRRQIVARLVELAEEDVHLSFDAIYKMLLTDPDAEVRALAIGGFWENEEPSLIEPFVGLLQGDKSVKVQAVAAAALGRFSLLAENGRLRPEAADRVRQALLGALADEDLPAEVKRRVLEAASPFSLPQVKEAIRTAYKAESPGFRAGAVYAMGKNCDPSWLPFLLKELSSSSAEIRYEAAAACGELEEEAAVPRLIEITGDADTEVQLAAIQSLGKIGGGRARKCLEGLLCHPRESVRQVAEESMATLDEMTGPLSFGFDEVV
jgi:HEAT repeat protein